MNAVIHTHASAATTSNVFTPVGLNRIFWLSEEPLAEFFLLLPFECEAVGEVAAGSVVTDEDDVDVVTPVLAGVRLIGSVVPGI